MSELISNVKAYGVFDAVPAAFAAMAVYLVIRLVLLKKNAIPRKPFVSEAAGALLVGYLAALVMIVWITRWTSWEEFVNKISDYGSLWQDGYHYKNNKRILRFFSDELMRYERFEVLANVALFVPLGFLLPVFWRKLRWWQVDLICLGTTCVVELVQPLVNGVGDLDDIITNFLGGVIGCALAKICLFTADRVKKRKKSV